MNEDDEKRRRVAFEDNGTVAVQGDGLEMGRFGTQRRDLQRGGLGRQTSWNCRSS